MMYHISDHSLKPYKSVEGRTMYLVPRPDLNNATLPYGEEGLGSGQVTGVGAPSHLRSHPGP
jgi:hypothetical protein